MIAWWWAKVLLYSVAFYVSVALSEHWPYVGVFVGMTAAVAICCIPDDES